ncbi:M20/M25/M40 family metallo-hydrolase [Sphingomonas gilva]|uniref:Carboxypeptidase Q n=1 Tax=Sphingomonas gilva TaxID=2305907 RepID=A0A396RXC5_9SPHN|nr:M20/M25/M40 family metallo-hydrolase [Sphingomonas gilva]RHW18371.1 M20/M25/M40 family metallo-hydrolase [Sphingomonas gilva]
MRHLLLAATALIAAAPLAAQSVDRQTVNRIIDQGTNQSQVMQMAQHMTDVIGPRLTNSPQMREAEAWAQARFREMGLKNVRAEGFDFGRGWSIERSSVRMTTPRPIQLRAIPIAWTPATNGALTAPIVVAPMSEEEDFAKYRGTLAGKIVLVTHPGQPSDPTEPAFKRLSGEDLSKLDNFQQPTHDPEAANRRLERLDFAKRRDAFLKAEGAVAWAQMARRDGGLLHGEGYLFKREDTPALPAVEIAQEDYRRLTRLVRLGKAPTLEIVSDVTFHDEDPMAYNIIADIPGTDPDAGYVMAGAHYDSWVGGDGAVDNAAGSAVVMEAARILTAIGARPKRTIRFVLWNGEEQGLHGSFAYVTKYLASRPPETDPAKAQLDQYYTWGSRWPITPKPGFDDLAAYFNLDNGSGRIRGIYAENNPAVVPIFKEWLAPFASMDASTVAIRRTGGTDHVFMQQIGAPGYQFIQDPLDYGARAHHTSIDTYDRLRAEDMRQNAIIMASFLLNAANADKALPRPPLPQRPVPTDPFAWPKDDD